MLAGVIRGLKNEGKLVVNKDVVKAEAIRFASSIPGNSTRSNAFKASDGWVQNFKARQKLHSNKPKLETADRVEGGPKKLRKPPRTSAIKQEERNTYIVELLEVVLNYTEELIFNLDETPAAYVEKESKAWGDKGERPIIKTLGDKKANITVIPVVTMSGEKLPLAYIHKAKTDRIISTWKFHKDLRHIAYYTPSGWVNDQILIDYIQRAILPHVSTFLSPLKLNFMLPWSLTTTRPTGPPLSRSSASKTNSNLSASLRPKLHRANPSIFP